MLIEAGAIPSGFKTTVETPGGTVGTGWTFHQCAFGKPKFEVTDERQRLVFEIAYTAPVRGREGVSTVIVTLAVKDP